MPPRSPPTFQIERGLSESSSRTDQCSEVERIVVKQEMDSDILDVCEREYDSPQHSLAQVTKEYAGQTINEAQCSVQNRGKRKIPVTELGGNESISTLTNTNIEGSNKCSRRNTQKCKKVKMSFV